MGTKEVKRTEFIEWVKNELDLLGKGAAYEKELEEIKTPVILLCTMLEKNSRIGSFKMKVILRLFAKLASGKPLTALTGEDDEWKELPVEEDEEDEDEDEDDTDIFGDPIVKEEKPKDENPITHQNKRCPYIYKRKDGTCFNSQAVVFSYDGKTWYRDEHSNENITFPYEVPLEPKRVRINTAKKNPLA